MTYKVLKTTGKGHSFSEGAASFHKKSSKMEVQYKNSSEPLRQSDKRQVIFPSISEHFVKITIRILITCINYGSTRFMVVQFTKKQSILKWKRNAFDSEDNQERDHA